MRLPLSRFFALLRSAPLLSAFLVMAGQGLSKAEAPANWWKPEWTARKNLTVNTGAEGIKLDGPPGSPAVLVRLSGDFAFASAKEDGSDLRFVTTDNKVLPSHVEKWDGLLNEALVWFKLPDLKSGATTEVWLYYGNPAAEPAQDPKGTYDEESIGIYHFSEGAGVLTDSSAAGISLEGTAIPVATALIGSGVRFTGQNSLTLPANPAAGWTANGALTLSVWVKPATLKPNAVIFSRRENANAFLVGLDNGVPFVSIDNGSGIQRSAAATPVVAGSWSHIAVNSLNSTITLYLNGAVYGTVAAGLPGMGSAALVGKDTAADSGFAGEMDELHISRIVRSPAAIAFAAANQSPGADAAKLMQTGAEEVAAAAGHSEISEHLNLIKDISKSLTFDGWVVIWLCGILALIGWLVAIQKLIYLGKIAKSSKVFLKQWSSISTDITALDHADEDHVKSMGGNTSRKEQRAMKDSPLFHLYHLGSQEIQHRISNARGNFKGLSERSITSIRALLDGGATRETQKLQSKLVFLTIGIAGGPYLGLLGTVIGVMITFAVIAKSGEVDINSIAPGIAGALLATVAGLAVAIPALFAYSYLASRIKDAILGMNTFIEEFIARIAEAYPSNE